LRDLHAVVDAADHQAFFAPVELVGLAKLEGQGHEGVGRHRLALALAPCPHEVGDAAVAAVVAFSADLRVQRARRAPLVAGAVRVGLQGQLQRFVERAELAGPLTAPVARLALQRRLQPLAHRVARQTRQPHDLSHGLALAEMHPPYLANHGHGDHSSSPAEKDSRVG
jgi:hypothetical protein